MMESEFIQRVSTGQNQNCPSEALADQIFLNDRKGETRGFINRFQKIVKNVEKFEVKILLR